MNNIINIMVVSRNSYRGDKVVERLQSLLGDKFNVFGCYRDYFAKNKALDCDFIIGDGTCKTRDDNESYPIYFSARFLAYSKKKHYMSMLWTYKWTAWLSTIIIRQLTLNKSTVLLNK